MIERPVTLSAWEVEAVLNGAKTQFRRLVTQADKYSYDPTDDGIDILWATEQIRCPYGVRGDRLWVREAFTLETNRTCADSTYQPPFSDRPVNWQDDVDGSLYWEQPHYRATDPVPALAYANSDEPECKWRSSTTMPRWASRFLLEITDVQVARLHEISESDARAEGVIARHVYEGVWNNMNMGRGYDWNSNPWVWVVDFRRAA